MLDRSKLTKQLELVVKYSFDAISQELEVAKKLWKKINEDSDFVDKAQKACKSCGLPDWEGSLNAKNQMDIEPKVYTVVSVDGSQIYPDRHQGTDCFLINISEIILHYGQTRSGAKLESFPYVYSSDSDFDSEQLVNCRRQELEFKHGFDVAKQVKSKAQNPVVLIFDGSLIFWHLQSKDEQAKQLFFSKYISILNDCAKAEIVLCSYISLPKSKDLVSLLRFDVGNAQLFDYLTDADLVAIYLQEWQMSTIFKSNAEITKDYPENLKPHFFYANVGTEIARIEVPAYVRQNLEQMKLVEQIVVDQIKKGNGYPVALSEAHEQAVIKNYEKEFFYSLIKNFMYTAVILSEQGESKEFRLSNKLGSKNRPAI